MMCCGCVELDGVSLYPASYFIRMNKALVLERAHAIFTDTTDNHDSPQYSGWKVAALIEKHGLGALVVSRAARNPNSGRSVVVWTWTPAKAKLRAYGVVKKVAAPRRKKAA